MDRAERLETEVVGSTGLTTYHQYGSPEHGRQQHEPTRDYVIVFAQGHYDIFHLVEYSLLLGVKIRDVSPDIGSRQRVLAKHELLAWG